MYNVHTYKLPSIQSCMYMFRFWVCRTSAHSNNVIVACLYMQEPATEGTVTAYSRFNAETDAKTLRDAMKGFGVL